MTKTPASTIHASIVGASLNIKNLACVVRNSIEVPEWKGTSPTSVSAYVLSFKINKKIYSPNSIEIVLRVSGKYSSLCAKLEEDLIDSKVTLTRDVEGSEKPETLVDNYLIHDVRPKAFSEAGCGYTEVTIVAYSPDQLLTYDQYSMAYTGKRLCKDIISKELDGTLGGMFSSKDFATETLQNTMTDEEMIYPYLMQYNESFYNFIRRIAYRSGEYLYYEDGKLHVGLTTELKKDKTRTQVEYDTRTSMRRHIARHIATHHHTLNTKHDDKGCDRYADAPSFNEEFSAEDYFVKLVKDPNEISFLKKPGTWVKLVSTILSGEGQWWKRLAATGIALPIVAANDAETVAISNKKFNDKWKFETDDKGADAGKFDVPGSAASTFMPYINQTSMSKLMAKAYTEIREGEEITAQKKERLVLDSWAASLNLCQIIKLPDDSREFVVVAIKRIIDISNASNNTYTVDIVPLPEGNAAIFPPKQDDIETVRYMSPQTAFVTGTSDPAGLGRMQVRFQWQTLNGDATPFIRFSSLLASKGGGVMFTPNEGDEVVVNFTNGNADQPYVAGYLFNKDCAAPKASRTIRSCNGHSITFTDPADDEAFAHSVFPMLDPIMKWHAIDKDNRGKSNKDALATAKEDYQKAVSVLEGTKKEDGTYSDTDYQAYKVKCANHSKRKAFIQKATQMVLEKKVYTDDELLNLKFSTWEKKVEKDDKIEGFYKPGKHNCSNDMYDLRAEIASLEKSLTDNAALKMDLENWLAKHSTENTTKLYKKNETAKNTAAAEVEKATDRLPALRKYYANANALKESDVLTSDKHNKEDLEKNERYDQCKKKESDTSYLTITNAEESLTGCNTKTNSLDKLQCVVDYIDNDDTHQKFIRPDKNDKGSKDYKDLVSKYEAMVSAETKTLPDKPVTGPLYAGGITMADDAGLYKIDMSATKRAITISCPLGNVKIDALTGITISAPNGDVNITGKNVNITAGNNVTIQSGQNREKATKDKDFSAMDQADWINFVSGIFPSLEGYFPTEWAMASGTFGAPVDMNAVRCVIECILRPVEGTLKIHTANNLLLESGGANTALNRTDLETRINQRQTRFNRAAKIAAGVNYINDFYESLGAGINAARAVNNYDATNFRTLVKTLIEENNKVGKPVNPNNAAAGKHQKTPLSDMYDVLNKVVKADKNNDVDIAVGNFLDKVASKGAIVVNADGTLTLPDKKDCTYKYDDFVTAGMKKDWSEAYKAIQYKLPTDKNIKTYYKSIYYMNDVKKKYEDVVKDINAHIRAQQSRGYVDIASKLKALIDSKTYQDSMCFSSKIMDILKASLKNAVQNGTNSNNGAYEVTAKVLLAEKRKALYCMVEEMIKDNAHDLASDIFLGGHDSRIAYFYDVDDTGNVNRVNLPDENSTTEIKDNDKNWEDDFLLKLKEAVNDDHKVAKALINAIDKNLLGGTLSTVQNTINLVDEWHALKTEAQGQLYLSTKDGTSLYNGSSKQLQGTTALNTKLENIIGEMKKKIDVQIADNVPPVNGNVNP